MPIYTITPNDVLFFRDARPMSGSSSGHGARWPEPNILFDALHAALHRAYPEQPGEWEHLHRAGKSGRYTETRDKRFGSLKTAGPFPCEGEAWYFPRPQDAVRGGVLRPLKAAEGQSNLPAPLRYPLASPAVPSKEELAPWWDKAAIEAYLLGGEGGSRKQGSDFFASEWATGIGINPETQTQDGTHIYSAEYLRLEANVHLGLAAALPLKNGAGDGLEHLFVEANSIVVGGQQRACRVEMETRRLSELLPLAPEIQGERVKWVLLAPALFPELAANPDKQVPAHPGGWLPSWVDADGNVMLKDGPGVNKTKRRGGTPGQALRVRLVAARIPKAIAISGWSERKHLERTHGATKTLLAVPAGAVYYFEGPDAPRLAALLNWHGKGREDIVNRRSALWGEKGFGLGVCGTWEAFG